MHIMKKYIIILAAFAFALGLSSCDQSRLDIPQQGVIAESDFYKTDADCEEALAGAYAGLFHSPMRKFFTYFYAVTAQRGLECYTGAAFKNDKSHWLMFYTEDPTHSYISDSFMALFTMVYRCNLVIDNFGYRDDATPVMKNAVAEAKVLRSFAYIYLTQYWGNPPLVDHVLRTSDEYRAPNSSPEELWPFIIKTLDEAINSGALTSKSDVNDKTAVRATKEFAMALKGKAQVCSGDYAGAKTTLKAIIDSKKYALIPSDQLKELFWSSKGNHNVESVFETNQVLTAANYSQIATNDEWSAYNIISQGTFSIKPGSYLLEYGQAWNHWTPSYEFIDAMIKHEGMHSARFEAWFYSYEDAQDMGLVEFSTLRSDNVRAYLEKTKNSEDVPDINCPSDATVDHSHENCGFWPRKLTPGPEEIYDRSFRADKVDRRYFRYAEVLLLYAEACAQLGETSGDGLAALNQIAERAGAPLYDKLTLENVKTEKWFEMWGEHTRFADVIRWGDGPTTFASPNNSIPVFFGYKEGKSGADLNADGTNFRDVYEIRFFDVAAKLGTPNSFKKGRDELLPFPATEIAANPNLVQNPGW